MPERLAPSPIILGDSELGTTVESPGTGKKPYNFSKCNGIKKGHNCPAAKRDQGADASPADSISPRARAVRNMDNLTRLAQRVEGDNARGNRCQLKV